MGQTISNSVNYTAQQVKQTYNIFYYTNWKNVTYEWWGQKPQDVNNYNNNKTDIFQ